MTPARRPQRHRRSINTALLMILALVLVAVVRARDSVQTDGARVQHVTINAPLINGTAPLTLVTPAGGGRGRPLLVFLHGRGGDQNSEITNQLFQALRSVGGKAPDIVFPFGGDHSYWHDRVSGAWGSYVLREVIPFAVAHLHADPRRVAIGGISMGGFGAYDLARLAPGRFCAVGGHSAALWPAAADTAPGAFDDAADFARNDVIAAARAKPQLYGNARLWLDGGSADPFHSADEQLAAALHIRMQVWPGGHEPAYWNAHWTPYMRFYAQALAACGPDRSSPPNRTTTAATTTTATAASCVGLSPAAEFRRADVVAIGTMLSGRTASMAGRSVLISPARMRVSRYLKGHGPPVISVTTAVTAATGGTIRVSEDGIMPLATERWKIYATGRRSPFTTSICGGSALLRSGA